MTTEKQNSVASAQPFYILPPKKPPNAKALKGMGHIHDNLPQLPFTVMLVGPRHSGKTCCLLNLLSNRPGSYGAAFKKSNIVLYSPTYSFDTTLHDLELKYVYTPPQLLQPIVDKIKRDQETFKNSGNMTGVLLVLEDITKIREAWKVYEDLSFTGRHYGINSIAVAHKLSSIPRSVRTQNQQWCLWRPNEESEHQWILEMFSRKRTYDIWEQALDRAWKIKYNFVYVDFESEGLDRIYRSGFNSPLFTPEEMQIIDSCGLVYRGDFDPPPAEESKVVIESKSIKRKRGRPRKHFPSDVSTPSIQHH